VASTTTSSLVACSVRRARASRNCVNLPLTSSDEPVEGGRARIRRLRLNFRSWSSRVAEVIQQASAATDRPTSARLERTRAGRHQLDRQ
jgi:hypothetical protein